ncbi:MAG: bifunctional homocysteine S-methyltransferase/methylenetetrahydrofolate reductase [Anaerolineaceae bacterium]|nr:MAG: bifunctional homocysteine S-methyltransferase/methylenetetrahydrofolate reductase [Anaerolineaceae bacterium]
MTKGELFREWLNSNIPILADGAMGTLLHSNGVPLDACFDELNLKEPKRIADAHRAYIQARAKIIETNSFGANRYKLATFGLENDVEEINRTAVELAKEAAASFDHEVLIAGSLGPLGVQLAPYGRVTPEEAYRAFHEQIGALIDAGADLIIIETQSSIHEAREALRATRDVTDQPVIASVTFTRDDRTLLGEGPAEVAKVLLENGADVIGANCSSGPAQLLRIAHQMRQVAPEVPLSLMPNAGWPEQIGGRIMYPATPKYFADYALVFCEMGASVIGGCCGTTPEHITAMQTALNTDERPCSEIHTLPLPNGVGELLPSIKEPTELASRLDSGHFIISVEMNPPRGFSAHKLLAGAHLLANAGADVINVADSPMARMRMSPWAICQMIQTEVGIETVLHFPTRGRNLLRVQGDLLASHALGVRNLFVVMGDPTAIGDFPEAMDNYDLVPSGLINLIKHEFNSGVDHAGVDIGEATSFFVGCALNLCAADPDREMKVLRRKLLAGADFILTQPIYDPQTLHQFLQRYQSRYETIETPILLGVLPLFSEPHATFLHNEVPGIQIPDSIKSRIAHAGKRAPEEGVLIATELLEELSGTIQGVYLIPAFNRYDLVVDIIEVLRV